MKRRIFGPTGKQVSVIGQGTWNMERADRRASLVDLFYPERLPRLRVESVIGQEDEWIPLSFTAHGAMGDAGEI